MPRLKSPNIYEADYEGFFNNVNHQGLEDSMIDYAGMSYALARFLTRINKSIVRLTKEDKIPEPERKIIFDQRGKLTENAKSNQDDFNSRVAKSFNDRLLMGKV